MEQIQIKTTHKFHNVQTTSIPKLKNNNWKIPPQKKKKKTKFSTK